MWLVSSIYKLCYHWEKNKRQNKLQQRLIFWSQDQHFNLGDKKQQNQPIVESWGQWKQTCNFVWDRSNLFSGIIKNCKLDASSKWNCLMLSPGCFHNKRLCSYCNANWAGNVVRPAGGLWRKKLCWCSLELRPRERENQRNSYDKPFKLHK